VDKKKQTGLINTDVDNGYGLRCVRNAARYEVLLGGSLGRRTTLVTGRLTMPLVVRMPTTRTLPSAPGKTESILPSRHSFEGKLSSLMIFCGDLPLVALVELLKVLILLSSAELLMERL